MKREEHESTTQLSSSGSEGISSLGQSRGNHSPQDSPWNKTDSPVESAVPGALLTPELKIWRLDSPRKLAERTPSTESVFFVTEDDPAFSLPPENPHSVLNVLTEMKKIPPVKQLINHIRAMLQQDSGAVEGFVMDVERLTRMDREILNTVLEKTGKIVLSENRVKQLEEFLDLHFKAVTNAMIDSVHTGGLDDLNEQSSVDSSSHTRQDTLNIKLKLYRNIVAISVLEKLLFPQKELYYCQELIFKGFSDADKRRLGAILKKIDPRFNLEAWLFRWNTGQRHVDYLGSRFFDEAKYSSRDVVRVESGDADLICHKKNCCC